MISQIRRAGAAAGAMLGRVSKGAFTVTGSGTFSATFRLGADGREQPAAPVNGGEQ
jgi:hypothetical protein